MAVNLVKLLEKEMSENPLKSVDPNTQSANDEGEQSAYYLYHRGIMASALIGLYQFSRDENNIKDLLSAEELMDFPDRIFNHKFSLLSQKIAEYSGYSHGDTHKLFIEALRQLVGILQEQVGNNTRDVKDFLSDQRTNILSYIPGKLEAGALLNNNGLDDRTNKMHGPFSDFTHWIEQLFSRSDK